MKRQPARATRHILAGAAFFGLVETSEGATLHVSNRGVDGPSCGSTANRCRSITQAIDNASPGDTIMVGPGRYGDLNVDGTLGDAGEENGSPGCGCMLSINKPVILLSTDGAAATVINAETVPVNTNVLIIASGVEFGRPNHGFTVTPTSVFEPTGIAIDANNVKVRGNQVVLTSQIGGAVGISTVSNDFETILIEANQVTGWRTGIRAVSARKTVSKNHISGSMLIGIEADGGSGVNGNISIARNVVAANAGVGISLKGAVSATGNAIVGNTDTGIGVNSSFTGTITKNNIFGNNDYFDSNCGLSNFGVSGLAATGNYWGAASGPGPNPADGICDYPGGTTITTPFATGPFAINPTFDP